MDKIKVLDKMFRFYISQKDVEDKILKIADEINTNMCDKNPVFVVVLNGAFMFAAELFKHINIDCEICFIKLSSYKATQSTGEVRRLIGVDKSLEGRNVVVVEDIVDTGTTIDYIYNYLKDCGVCDINIATLFYKPETYRYNHYIDYPAILIHNDFIIGYGLDYNQHGRNLPNIYVLDE